MMFSSLSKILNAAVRTALLPGAYFVTLLSTFSGATTQEKQHQ
jgi:hypothetical protein